MSKAKNTVIAMILILVGCAFQNITWYFRLQDPMMLREFEIYWRDIGPRLFLDFNVFNYFFIVLLLIAFLVFYFIEDRRKKLNDAKRGKSK